MLDKIRKAIQNVGPVLPARDNRPAAGTEVTTGRRQVSVERFDVTPFASELDLARLQVLTNAPVWMTRAERLMLFSLIFCFRPKCYLEIGTFQGGSALIVANALAALDSEASMFCVDPEPKIAPEHWAQLQARVQLFQGYSPQILNDVAKAAGRSFDFALIDGDHSYAGALRDAEGVLPHMSHGGYLLFHDAFHSEVRDAIDHFVHGHGHALTDLGLMTREITTMQNESNSEVEWGGLRLLYIH